MKKLFILIFFVLILLSACSSKPAITDESSVESIEVQNPVPEQTPSPESAIKANVESKLESVLNNNIEQYLTTISDENEYYYTEQRRWFYGITNENISGFSLNLLDVEMIDDYTAIATINEKHYHFEQFDFDYQLLYKQIDGLWLDCDYPFEEKQYDSFVLKYQPGETRVIQFAAVIQKSLDALAKEFDTPADSKIEIKMFYDRELLRQRTIPTIRRLFTGWGEADESIKFYSGFEDVDRYYPIFMHEFTHRITLKMCNNNIPGWFAEGLAVSYGTYTAADGTALENDLVKKEDVSNTLQWLSEFDNEASTDEAQITSFYHGAGMFVEFLRSVYGEQIVRDILTAAGEKPYNISILNDNFNYQNQQTLLEVFASVLDKSLKELSDEYLEWLDEY